LCKVRDLREFWHMPSTLDEPRMLPGLILKLRRACPDDKERPQLRISATTT
jgi:hypothetical protein